MPESIPVYRAPMRARDRDLAPGEGAEFGVSAGLVGIGEVHGEKADRMLAHFAELPDGVFVWTRLTDSTLRLGRIDGPWRHENSSAARSAGIHHVRPAVWLDRRFEQSDVHPRIPYAFDRGGRNFQRIRDVGAEEFTVSAWVELASRPLYD